MNKHGKGEYGYLNAYKREKLILISILLTMIAAIVISLIVIFGDTQRGFVIFAILLSLPLAKVVIAYIISYKFVSISKSEYEKINNNKNENGNYLYDLMISKYEGVRFFQSICVMNNNIVALAVGVKYPLKKNEYEKWLNQTFADSKYEYNVVIVGEVDEFIDTIKGIASPDDTVKLIDKHIVERILGFGV